MFEDLIEYEQLEEACEQVFGFSGVTFKRDFGPWKAGQKVDNLWFDLEKGMVKECNEIGDALEDSKFRLEAVD